MKKIKTLLIGLGKIGFSNDLYNENQFLSHSKVLKKINYIDFVCGVDKDKRKLSKFKEKYKIDASNNLRHSILKHKPSFIVVSVNTDNLFFLLKKIHNFETVKNVLVEKPGCKNFNNLKEIINIYKKKKINLYINYNRSYDLKIRNFFKNIKSKDYFKSVYLYNRGFLNNCSHFLNLVFLNLDLPKKIQILKKGKKFKSDIQPDVKLTFKNGEILFVYKKRYKTSHNEFFLHNKKYKLKSNKNFTDLKKYKKIRNAPIQNKDKYLYYSNYKIDKKIYQIKVYNEILKNKNIKLIKKINESSLKILYFYRKLTNNYNKK